MKFLAEVINNTGNAEWTVEVEAPTKKEAHNSLEGKYTVLKMENASTHHVCKYCGSITQGTDKDVLCQDCRETFGHAFYSEL